MIPALDDADDSWLKPLTISATYGVSLHFVSDAMARGELPSIDGQAHEADVQAWREQLDASRIDRHARAARRRQIKRRAEVLRARQPRPQPQRKRT